MQFPRVVISSKIKGQKNMEGKLLNHTIEVWKDFQDTNANYFFFSALLDFDPGNSSGHILCKRFRRKLRLSFNQEMMPFEEAQAWEFPDCYGQDKIIAFSISFLKDGIVRFLFDAGKNGNRFAHDVPLVIENIENLNVENPWPYKKNGQAEITYKKNDAEIVLISNPFIIEIRYGGKTIQRTVSIHEKTSLLNDSPIPCGFIQKSGTEEREFIYSSFIRPGEKFFGCGESFTRLDKRGQLLNLSQIDAKGVSSDQMYKPVPFFMSNGKYGCFIHTSCPLSVDFGHGYDGASSIYLKESVMDLFIMTGSPKEILSKYTSLTGRSPILPKWSFGLWMGRITYNSRAQVEDVAAKLRDNDIPCDVIHIDTGWFEKDWRCDFKFSSDRFPDVEKMLEDLHKRGFHISLWQLPYITPDNELFRESVDNGLVVTRDGDLPGEDAILDFSNSKTVEWYQNKLASLLGQGVDVIKADFGEAAPYDGSYCSGKSGTFEHNLYPLRYQQAVSQVTERIKHYPLIWARSAWAGCQRYPVHWGGDAENTNSAMLASLRGGLSLGLCGFTYWSHDIGGFVSSPNTDLYLRWLAFGMFTSHARCHGNPPKEPWEFPGNFMTEFRKLVKIRYSLIDYIAAEAEESSKNGWPMLRTLFFEFPEDITSWMIEDEYMFGKNYLVAPIFEDSSDSRNVYLPAGTKWQDIFSDEEFDGGHWSEIRTTNYIVVLKRKYEIQ